jgi:signal transduction histidine kinase
LFDMFFKGNENSKGNGLGLYIVLKSIKALKGEVEVESQPGHYSKFIVTLPTHMESRSSSVKELADVISQ